MRAEIGIAVTMLLAAAGPAAAQSPGSADAALEAYQLTMPNVRKMAAAYERLDAALKANPALADKLAKEEGASSAEELVTRLDREPVTHQAIAGAGITTCDLVLTQLATFSAGMTDYAVQAGAKPPTTPAAAANLRLYQQNRPEIEQLTARLKQLSSWQAVQADGDSEDSAEE
jgi:hypothetical protein